MIKTTLYQTGQVLRLRAAFNVTDMSITEITIETRTGMTKPFDVVHTWSGNQLHEATMIYFAMRKAVFEGQVERGETNGGPHETLSVDLTQAEACAAFLCTSNHTQEFPKGVDYTDQNSAAQKLSEIVKRFRKA